MTTMTMTNFKSDPKYFRGNDYSKNPVVMTAGNKVKVGKAKFSGKFDQVKLGMYITKVLYNDPATIVFWSDGTKTISKAQEGDSYNKELGLTLCVLKKLVGSSQVISLLKEWVDFENDLVDLKLIRSKKREINKVEEVIVEKPAKKISSTITKNKKEESTQ